jgi:hypothetical protein
MVLWQGFAKLAIESGVDIVPVFCFGEKWMHDLASPPGLPKKMKFCLSFILSLEKSD